jgi:hypothetical protein
MEEIEIASWNTLDAIKKAAKVVDTVGNLQTGHSQSIFCVIEDDFLELYYSDSSSNYLRRYDDREEFEIAIEKQLEDDGAAPFEEEGYEEDEEEKKEEGLDIEDDSDHF